MTRVTIFATVGSLALGVLHSQNTAAQPAWSTPPPSVAAVRMDKPENSQSARFDVRHPGLLSRVTKLEGKKVQDDFGRKLGTLEDLVIDLQSGKVLGGLVDIGKGTAMVVPSAFFPVSEERVVYHDKTKSLKNVPRIVVQQNEGPLDLGELAPAYRYFGVTPPPAGGASKGWLASSLMGQSISTDGNRVVGNVRDLVVDVPKGQVAYVVVKPTNDNGQFIVLPPQALAVVPGQKLKLNIDQQKFLAGPRVPAEFWTEMTMPGFAERVYRYYGLLPQESPSFTSTPGANSPSPGQTSNLSPTGRSDEQLRNAVLSEIVQGSSLSMAAVNSPDLNISVRNGQVVLSGSVGSQNARQELVSAASKAVGAANVIDQLRVR